MSFSATNFALSKKYTDDSIEGTSGVLAGKNCRIQSTEDIEVGGRTGKRITFAWYRDDESVARTTTIEIMDGEQGIQGVQGEPGEQGEQGEPGFSPIIEVYESTATTYKLQITTEEGSFITPNLKGGGSGGLDVSVNEETLVFTY